MTPATTGGQGPHAGRPILARGAPPGDAAATMILVHGRNASADAVLPLAQSFANDRVAFLAPAAAGGTWYPFGFMSPTERNEPGLSSGLSVLDALVGDLAALGVPAERVVLLGFSQGACLAAEYAVRHARPYGGVIAYSGGLIGPPGTSWDHDGDFAGTPVFLGCSDVDSHVPLERVDESEAVFVRMNARVEKRIYPGMAHTVVEDEVAWTRDLLRALTG